MLVCPTEFELSVIVLCVINVYTTGISYKILLLLILNSIVMGPGEEEERVRYVLE